MSVIVWDGKCLATDRQANDGSMKWEAEKAWYVTHKEKKDMKGAEMGWVYVNRHAIVSGVGMLGSILKMRDCFIQNGNLSGIDVPHNSAELIVVSKKGLSVWSTNGTAVELSAPMAFGEGREYALGAMAMGATAEEAVQIANEYSLHCGKGVLKYTLHEGKVEGDLNGKTKEI